MFYSHELLTNKKSGVATIWMAATMGSKSSLKKLTRRAILDVNVSSACQTITDPGAPMALRLQGNLLFGVSKVFSQQCGYFLTDIQNLRDKMQNIYATMRQLQTDPRVVASRPEQLNLNVETVSNLDLNFDLNFLFYHDTELQSTQASMCKNQNSGAGFSTAENDCDLLLNPLPSNNLPLSSADELVKEGIDFCSDMYGIQQDHELLRVDPASEALPPGILYDDELNLDLGQDLNLDSTAQFRLVQDNTEMSDAPNAPTNNNLQLSIEEGQSEEEMREVREALPPGLPALSIFPSGQELLTLTADVQTPAQRRSSGDRISTPELSSDMFSPASSVVATTHQASQKARAGPVVDVQTELPNRVLSQWHNDYSYNMRTGHLDRLEKISLARAKKKAAYWMLGQRDEINIYDGDMADHPLAQFTGQALLNLFLHRPRGTKRSSSPINDGMNEDGRRIRSSPPHIPADDQNGIVNGDDHNDTTISPQVGRAASRELSNRDSSVAPWHNFTAQSSQFAGRQRTLSRQVSASRAAGSIHSGPHASEFATVMQPERATSVVQPSPLYGKGPRSYRTSGILSNLSIGELPGLSSGDNDNRDFELTLPDLDDTADANTNNNFELVGPAERTSARQADDSTLLATTLEEEAANFLTYVGRKIEKAQAATQSEDRVKGEKV